MSSNETEEKGWFATSWETWVVRPVKASKEFLRKHKTFIIVVLAFIVVIFYLGNVMVEIFSSELPPTVTKTAVPEVQSSNAEVGASSATSFIDGALLFVGIAGLVAGVFILLWKKKVMSALVLIIVTILIGLLGTDNLRTSGKNLGSELVKATGSSGENLTAEGFSLFSMTQRIDLALEEPEWQDLADGKKYRVYMPLCTRLDAYPQENVGYERHTTYVDVWSKFGRPEKVQLTLKRSTHPNCS